ncbi:MAG: hypothetical protein ACSHW7_09850 [Patiriisocius sp.]|uniref:hypothetical protein n=1 Tax=Patiriisocius sp. TaxID=2822396 RepID=UPI003EF856E5
MELLDRFFALTLNYFVAANILLYGYSAIKLKYNKSLNILTLYLALICLHQLLSSYLSSVKLNNLFLFHSYLIFQFICLSFFYKIMFNKYQKIFVNLIIIIVIGILFIYYGLNAEKFEDFHAPEILIATVPIVAYILVHLYNSLTTDGLYLIFTSGLLIYLSISSLVWILYAVSVEDSRNAILDRETSDNISFINEASYFLFQIVIFLEWKLNISKWKINKK